jgi:signal transduction histidine kinase
VWFLHFFPEWLFAFIVYGLLGIGVVGSFLSFFILNHILNKIPGLAKYYRIAQLVSIVSLVLGVYLWGGYSMEMAYRERVAELQKELEVAKEESKKVNTVIQTKIVTKTKVIKEKGETIVQQVDKLIPVEKDCALPKEAVDVHNEAARMNKAIDELRKGEKK